MASEEVQDDNILNQTQLPPPPPPPPPAAGIIPPYPEMILAAIEALGDPNGSNKSSISKQIEATYGDLPPAHSTLLAHHLNRMKASAELVFLKNNYLIPDPNAPPRRGRGRPPKPKTPLPPGIPRPPSRPRGRPPKSRDPDAPPPPKPKPTSEASILSVRKRGRPPKAATAAVSGTLPPSAVTEPPRPAAVAPRRGRGRPPKVKPTATAPVGA